MRRSIITVWLLALALLISSGLSLAQSEPGATRAGRDKSVAKETKPAPQKLIDINSASKAELSKLPGISEAEADKIIAGRPYRTKADLVTKKIIPTGVYFQIRKTIIARQKPEPAAKPGEKRRPTPPKS